MNDREKLLIEREKSLIEILRNAQAQPNLIQTQSNSAGSVMNHTRYGLRDISDVLPEFDPTCPIGLSAVHWVSRVDSLIKIYSWDSKVVVLATATKLRGPAKHWHEAIQESVLTWHEFKTQLILSFPSASSEVEIHQLLTQRKRKPDEDITTYCYEMNMVGKRAQLSDQSIFQYIIMGQTDVNLINSIAATSYNTMIDLITQIKKYENIRRCMRTTSDSS